jgi:cell division protein FtsQ
MPRVKPRPAPPPLPDRPGRWKLLVRRQRRLLRPTMIASIAVIGVMVLAIAGNLLGHLGTLGRATAGLGLDVQSIVIDGRQKTAEADVLAALGVTKGAPILGFSANAARARLEALTWVRSAIVERQLPDTIHVTLVERAPFAVWQNQGRFALVDRAGNVVTDSQIGAFRDKLPLIVGLGAPETAAPLLDLLAAQPDLAGRLVAAVRVGERRWNLCMTNGADVLLPEGAEPQAITRLAELQTSQDLLDRPLSVIDMRLPDRLRLRPLTEAPCGQRPDPSKTATAQPRKAT